MFTFPIKNLLFDIHPVFSDICRSCIAITKAVRNIILIHTLTFPDDFSISIISFKFSSNQLPSTLLLASQSLNKPAESSNRLFQILQ